jgi:DNA-directed RNA polymerase sigma subunit (sigma70/sigma32)
MKCYEMNYKNNKTCKKIECRYWLSHKKNQNCAIIAADKTGGMTLEEIGNIFSVTRMRICQIEKNAIRKVKEKIKKMRQKSLI